MSLPLLGLGFIILLAAAYRIYGRWIEKQFEINNSHSTPAHSKNDGVDYVPTNSFYLFGQHFSAIAAAGPIAGPILACQSWGWLPCLMWIGLGVVFIGAVHDFSSLAASVRHGGHSVAEIAGKHLGKRAGIAMMVFIWIALLYVIVAFTDITAGSFVHKSEELAAANVTFNAGGAVAAAAIFYLILSIIMGLVERFLKPKLWISTLIFVPLTFFMVWLGTQYSTLFIMDATSWGLLILAYCCVASVIPVWALLQPRGYLGGFILYTALALGVIGLFFGGFEVQQPAVKSWDIGGLTGSMFPFLFVTIACGACSGFHGLVCSGTTSKQINKEKDMHSIGYGAMLAEGFVALIALVTIMIMTSDEIKGLKPGTIYGNGIGSFLTMLIGEENRNFAITFGAMAFSTFVFDTLDVSTRLGRYLLQELLGWKGKIGAIAATLATMALPAYFIAFSVEGSWIKYWTLFGASNQLLAALTLLSITVWLYQARKRIAFTLIPMLFVLVITMYSLTTLVIGNFKAAIGFDTAMINGLFSLILILLAIYLAVTALLKVRGERDSTLTPELAV